MPAMTLTAAYVALTGSGPGTIHDHTQKAELTIQVEDKDVTTFASLGWKEHIGGLKEGTLALSLLQDIASGSIDEKMWGVLGTLVPFEVRLTQSAVSTANPKYTGNVLVTGWKPLNGSVGDVATVDVSYPTSGVVTRGTT